MAIGVLQFAIPNTNPLTQPEIGRDILCISIP